MSIRSNSISSTETAVYLNIRRCVLNAVDCAEANEWRFVSHMLFSLCNM